MLMRHAVLAGWFPFTGSLEGVVPWMYLDYLGLVTVAIGNLIDPMGAALADPFINPDGSPATREQIAAEWSIIKAGDCGSRSSAGCAWKGTGKVCFSHQGHLACKSVARLRLTTEGVERVVLGKLAQNEARLVARFPDYPGWCADGQLFVHSISWACGTSFDFPLLEKALRAEDWTAALANCHINDAGPDRIPGNADDNWGLKPRNAANKAMLENAIKVQAFHLDPDELLFPIPSSPLVAPPAGHVPPRQDASLLWEENVGSGAIIHPGLYDAEWVRPLDA